MQTSKLNKRTKTTTTPAPTTGPRDTAIIQQEAAPLWASAGQLQYELRRLQKELEHINRRLEALAIEANEFEGLQKVKEASKARQNVGNS